jgi:hypothetical protein
VDDTTWDIMREDEWYRYAVPARTASGGSVKLIAALDLCAKISNIIDLHFLFLDKSHLPACPGARGNSIHCVDPAFENGKQEQSNASSADSARGTRDPTLKEEGVARRGM